VARNRQRAKQRQAERRARRLAEERAGRRGAAAPEPAVDDAQPDADGGTQAGARDDRRIDDPTTVEPSAAVPPELAVGAPPQDEGRSDTVIEDEPDLVEHDPVLGDRPMLGEPPVEQAPADEEEALEEIEDWEVAEGDGAEAGAGEAGYEVRGRRGRAEVHKPRSRVVQFLIAVWAELQRVQWPNRQALITLTGVVLGFVLIAGGYLGLLDAIFSKLIQAIL
jgi:preprotein translocase SecE subunit